MRTNQNTGLRLKSRGRYVLEICTNVMVPGVDEMNAGILLGRLGTTGEQASGILVHCC